MIVTAVLAALASALVFTGLVLMSDRPRGAMIAQGGSLLAALLLAAAQVVGARSDAPDGLAERGSAVAVALLAATLSGMFYHLYLGRFDDVWRARFVFALVFLGIAAVLGLLFLSFLA